MANMSYCRFQNTLTDLFDCWRHIDEVDDLSDEEAAARTRLIEMCRQIANETDED